MWTSGGYRFSDAVAKKSLWPYMGLGSTIKFGSNSAKVVTVFAIGLQAFWSF